MRYPASEKLEIIRLVEGSHLSARLTLAKLGIPRTAGMEFSLTSKLKPRSSKNCLWRGCSSRFLETEPCNVSTLLAGWLECSAVVCFCLSGVTLVRHRNIKIAKYLGRPSLGLTATGARYSEVGRRHNAHGLFSSPLELRDQIDKQALVVLCEVCEVVGEA